MARELLAHRVASFVDDVFASEPSTAETSGFWVSKRLVQLVGFITSDRKGQQPTTSLLLLGAQVAIGTSSFEADATPDRAEKIRGRISQALQTNALTPCGC